MAQGNESPAGDAAAADAASAGPGSPAGPMPRWLGPAIAIVYAVTGKLSVLLALPPGYASAIFPPAGIAVGFLFLLGWRALAWVVLGSFALNVWISYQPGQAPSGTAIAAALAIAAASGLQALAGGAWLRRRVGYPAAFDNIRDLAQFLFSVPAFCLVSATLSVSALLALGIFEARAFADNWFAWWLGDTLGVIVFLPLVLIARGEPRALWRGRRLTVAAPLALAFALSVVVFLRTTSWEEAQSLRDFQLQATEAAGRIQTRLEEQELLVAQVAAFMSRGQERAVTREEFRRFVTGFLDRYPVVQAVEWAPRVAHQQLGVFEAAQRREAPDFKIRERDAAGSVAAAAERDAYFPVTYAVPERRNLEALGFDLVSTPNRRATVERALQADVAVASAPVRLLQDHGAAGGVLLLQRVPEGAAAGSVVLTVLRIGDFVDRTLGADRGAFVLRLVDAATGETLYDIAAGAAQGAGAFERRLSYGGREWVVRFLPSLDYAARHHGWQSFGLLAAGLLATGLLGALLLLGTGHAARIEATVAERTGALARESEKNRLLLHNAGDGIHILDEEGNVVEASDAFCRMLGYSRTEIIGMNLRQWDALGPSAALDEGLRNAFRREGLAMFEARHQPRSGPAFDVEVTAMRIELGGRPLMFCSSRNITERKAAERRLRESEARFRDMFENAPIGKIIVPGAGARIQDANRTFCEFLGYSLAELKEKTLRELSHPEDLPMSDRGTQRLLEGKARSFVVEKRYLHRDGRYRWSQSTATIVPGDARAPAYFIVQVQDIEQRRKAEAALEEARERLAMALEASELSIFDYDVRSGKVLLDERWARIMGYPAGPMVMRIEEISALTHPHDIERATRAAELALKGTMTEYAQESRLRTARGDWKWIRCTGKIIERDADGRALRCVGTNLDVSARKAVEERVREMAFHDSLTQLPNRALFLDRLQHSVASAHRESRPLSVLYLDLNRFKEVNDTRGHEAGDAVLRDVAQRFARVARESDTLARLGGDEFAVVAPQTGRDDALVLARRIAASLEGPLVAGGESSTVGVSIGIACYPEDGSTPEQLLRSADLAMYRAKAAGRSVVG
jgi:diguanylate cyclase (GGDEF)-like protein/PAS domain S-box-containing protein